VALHIRDSPPKYPQVMAIIINIIMMWFWWRLIHPWMEWSTLFSNKPLC
jgi:hypothetical protein